MDRERVLDITRRTLHCIDDGSLEVTDEARTVHTSVFTDPTRHRAELAMMASTPHVVGWAGEVPEPGDFTTKDVGGIPVLIVRQDDGALRAFVNACAHRGSQVAAGAGRTARFTCPYHAWSYRRDGTPAGVPDREMFAGVDLDACSLRALPISNRCGLLTVGLADDHDPGALLDDVADELTGFPYATLHLIESRTFVVNANWKLVVDVNFEGYHFAFLHRQSLYEIATNHSTFDTFGAHCRWTFPFRGIETLRDRPESTWPDQFEGTVVYAISPSCVLVESSGNSQMLRVQPGRHPGESIVTLSGATHGPLDETNHAVHLGGYEIAYNLLRDEDFPAAESCQRGAEAGLDRIIVGRNEPLLQHLHSTWQTAAEEVDPDEIRRYRPTPSIAAVPEPSRSHAATRAWSQLTPITEGIEH